MRKYSHIWESICEDTGAHMANFTPSPSPACTSARPCLWLGALLPKLTFQPGAPAGECPGPSSSPSTPCQRQPGSHGHSLCPWAKRAARENMQNSCGCQGLPVCCPILSTLSACQAHTRHWGHGQVTGWPADVHHRYKYLWHKPYAKGYDTGTAKLCATQQGRRPILILGEGEGNRESFIKQLHLCWF